MNEQYTGRESGNSPKENSGSFAAQAGQTGREAVHEVKDRSRRLADNVSDKANSALSSVGDGMSTIGEKIRENAPSSGQVGSAANAVADRLESSGRYLKEHDVNDLGKELTGIARRHPIQTLCVGVGLGVLFGSMLSRK